MTSKSFKRRILGAVRHSVPLTCAAFAADNFLASANLAAADPAPDEHLNGTNLEADLDYAEQVTQRYLSHGGTISGRVAEIGPGGNAAVALHLLAHGCDSVDLIDRFQFSHDDGALKQVYGEIIGRDPRLSELLGSSRQLDRHIKFHVGEDAAAEIFFRSHTGFNAILSCAVLEHLYDPIEALGAMSGALMPGGQLLHQVDLRDHGMFSSAGHHELTFLSIPGWFYPLMSRRRGRPNRVLVHRYREALDRLGLDYRIKVTHLVGVGEITPAAYEEIPSHVKEKSERTVEQYRGRLAADFRDLPTSDLAQSGIFIAARKTV